MKKHSMGNSAVLLLFLFFSIFAAPLVAQNVEKVYADLDAALLREDDEGFCSIFENRRAELPIADIRTARAFCKYGLILQSEGKDEKAYDVLSEAVKLAEPYYAEFLTTEGETLYGSHVALALLSSRLLKAEELEHWERLARVAEDLGVSHEERDAIAFRVRYVDFIYAVQHFRDNLRDLTKNVGNFKMRRAVKKSATKVMALWEAFAEQDREALGKINITAIINIVRFFAEDGDVSNAGRIEDLLLFSIMTTTQFLVASEVQVASLGDAQYDLAEKIILNNATACIKLAEYYAGINDVSNAFAILDEIKRALSGAGYADRHVYPECLTILGRLQMAQGDFSAAQSNLDAAFLWFSASEAEKSPYYSTCLVGLGYCYYRSGDSAVANEIWELARKVTPPQLKEQRAELHNTLGFVRMERGETQAALKDFEEAERLIGEGQSDVYQINQLDAMRQMGLSGSPERAVGFSYKTKEFALRRMLQMTARQRLVFWNRQACMLNVFNAYMAEGTSSKPLCSLYDNVLFAKGLLLRTSNFIFEKIASSDEGDMFSRLTDLNEQLERADADSLQKERLEAQRLERELLRTNVSYAAIKGELAKNWRSVERSLKSDEVAVEFLALPSLGDTPRKISSEFMALVLRKGADAPELVRLCAAEDLMGLLAVPAEIQKIPNAAVRNKAYRTYLYESGRRSVRAGLRNVTIDCVGDRLYSLLWEKLESVIGDAKRVYYSPIGLLNTLSFNAIGNGETTLGDKYDMRLVSTTGMLAQSRKEPPVDDAVAYGGIAYDAAPDDLRESLQSDASEASRGAAQSSWTPLDATLDEAKMVTDVMTRRGVRCDLKTAVAANEESFRALSGHSPKLIHVATHGFFLADESEAKSMNFVKAAERYRSADRFELSRSGLILAGANRVWTGQAPAAGVEDGILTAAEIADLDLSGTEMVVLSACETGLGRDMGSEGVFGLQRAFKLAGVRTIVMSLWSVSDAATSELMREFYSAWLEKGMEKHEAFAAAQKAVRAKRPDPYYWAGFVMMD